MSGPITLSSATKTLTKVNTNPFVTYTEANILGGVSGNKNFFNGLTTTSSNDALYYYSTTYSSNFSGGTDYLYIIHPDNNVASQSYQCNITSITGSYTLYYYLVGGGGTGSPPGQTYQEVGKGGTGGNLISGNIPLSNGNSFNITVGSSNVSSNILINGTTYVASNGSTGIVTTGNKDSYTGSLFTDYGFSINKNIYFYGGGGGSGGATGGGNGGNAAGNSGGNGYTTRFGDAYFNKGGQGGGFNRGGGGSYSAAGAGGAGGGGGGGGPGPGGAGAAGAVCG
jgi:hypothetical protein